MREIKFRGLRTDGEGWAHGHYLRAIDDKTNDVLCIIFPYESRVVERPIEVIPSTVGQFTGLTDKNGKEIYEGDLVNYRTIVKTDETGENITYKGEIQFWLGQVGCGWRYKSRGYTLMMKRSHAWSMEVIGNIHEKTNKND